MRTLVAQDPMTAWLGVALFLVMGFGGLYLALRWIIQDEAHEWREAHPVQARFTFASVFAVLGAAILFGSEIVDPCSEEALRRVCGSMWEWCWWLNGCAIFN